MHHPVGDANGLTEALRAVVEDAAVGARLRERGLRRAAAFSWDTAARQTWELYRSLQ